MNQTIKTKTCARCKQDKPSTEFTRKLTIAQSRAVLHNPNIIKPYIASSKLCKACQAPLKSNKPLTAQQIRTKMTNGDIHPMIGEAMLKKLREELPMRRSKAMKERWEKVKAEPALKLKDSISRQVQRFAKRLSSSKYLRSITNEQNKWLYKEAKRVRDDLHRRIDRGEQFDPELQIQTMFRPRKQHGFVVEENLFPDEE